MRVRVAGIIPSIKKHWTGSLRHTEMASLELEFHKVVSSTPYNTARACEILSALAKLYQVELREREYTTREYAPATLLSVAGSEEPGAGESPAREDDNSLALSKQCQPIIDEAKHNMASAQSREEIRAAFHKGILGLIETLESSKASREGDWLTEKESRQSEPVQSID